MKTWIYGVQGRRNGVVPHKGVSGPLPAHLPRTRVYPEAMFRWSRVSCVEWVGGGQWGAGSGARGVGGGESGRVVGAGSRGRGVGGRTYV